MDGYPGPTQDVFSTNTYSTVVWPKSVKLVICAREKRGENCKKSDFLVMILLLKEVFLEKKDLFRAICAMDIFFFGC